MTATTTDKRIDDLRSEMRRGFDQVDARFAQVDRRFDRVEDSIRELRAGQEGLRAEIKAGDDAVRLEMREGFAAVNASIEGMRKLLFQFLAGLVSTIVGGVVIAIVIALLKLHS